MVSPVRIRVSPLLPPVPRTHRPVVLKRLVVWLANRPEKIGMVGEAAGVWANTMIDGVAGDLAGNVGGTVLGKDLAVVVKRCRNRL